MRSRLIAAIIVALFIIQAIIRFRSSIHHDVAWYLYIADGLLHGKHLYTDFLEVNPPLGIWLTLPVVWLGSLTGLGSIVTFYSLLFALTAVSLLLVDRYLRLLRDVSDAARAMLCVFIAAAILFMPAMDFAEREHLVVLLFLPWPFLRLARSRGAQLGFAEASLVGLMAAMAICIKPQSLFAPLGVELVLLLRFRNFRGLFTAENIAAVIFALVYGAAITIFEPNFFETILPLGVTAYVPFYGYANSIIWLFSLNPVMLVAFSVFLWQRTEGPLADIAALLGAAAFGFILSYFIQYKGFHYQILPARIFAGMACAAAVSGIVARVPFAKWLPATKFLVGASALTVAMNFGFQRQIYPDNGKVLDAGIVRYAPGAQSIFIASTQVSHGFPFTLNRNLIWASRFPTQWLTPYVASKWQAGTFPSDGIVARALDWTVSDLVAFHPDIVFIDESKEQLYVPGGRFDYLKFWANDPRFEPFWAGYERRASMNGFAVYTAL
jgi:hypothetical protein